MLYFKMMSDQDMADGDERKLHTCLTIDDCKEYGFYLSREGEESVVPVLTILHRDGSTTGRRLFGNVYVMNESGKTIGSFSHRFPTA